MVTYFSTNFTFLILLSLSLSCCLENVASEILVTESVTAMLLLPTRLFNGTTLRRERSDEKRGAQYSKDADYETCLLCNS